MIRNELFMKKFTAGARLFFSNIKNILIFETVYNIISNALVIPLLRTVLNASIRVAGYKYISNRNLIEFIRQPSSVITILFILLFASVFTLFEISAVVYLFSSSLEHKKTGLPEMFFIGADSCRRAFSKENFQVILYSLFVLPLSKLSIMSRIITSAGIPDIASYYAVRKKSVLLIYIILASAALFLFIRWIFSMNYYVYEHENFRISRKKSSGLVKGSFFKTLVPVILWEISALLIFTAAAFIFSCVIYLLSVNGIVSESSSIISYISKTVLSGFSFLAVPVIFSFICTQCRSASCGISVDFFPKMPSKTAVGIFYTAVITAAALNIFYSYETQKNGTGIKMEIFNSTDISAHRGDCRHAPENTIPAFELAAENNADWIELDVHEAADGTVIVIHDSSFSRTAGLKRNTWELTYPEISQLDAGKYFSSRYKGTKIPSLEETIISIKGKAKLNIEIKPNAHEKNIEKSVVELIEKYDMCDECIVSSFSANSLKKIKSENPDIKTAYLMSIAAGSFEDIIYADALSINSAFITKNLVDSVHSCGKEVFAWTVNTRSEIIKMYDYDVDNIITDNPAYTRKIIESSDSANIFFRMFMYIFYNI